MKEESGLIATLDAEWQRTCALLMMQVCIEDGDFVDAMDCQLWYLYWTDEFLRLYRCHEREYWDLRLSVREMKLEGLV